MKTTRTPFTLVVLVVFGCLFGCKTDGVKLLTPPVVAPAGPATAAVDPAVKKDQDAHAAALSKISAAAGNIVVLNTGQPTGPKTDGVNNEAVLIVDLAGQPTAADRLAASERARIVAEGDAAKIAAAYAKATTEADVLKADAKRAKDDLATAQDAAKAEQAAQAAKFQDAFNKQAKDANDRILAIQREAEQRAKAEQTKWVTIIFFGVGALFIAGGIVVLVTAASVPMFGPKAGFGIIGAGVGLSGVGIVINQVQNFLFNHPWVVGTGVFICIAAFLLACGLMISNYLHHKDSLTATP